MSSEDKLSFIIDELLPRIEKRVENIERGQIDHLKYHNTYDRWSKYIIGGLVSIIIWQIKNILPNLPK